MKQKKDNFYYKNLVTCVECSYKAANFLKNAVRDYDHSALEKNLEEMHAMEQEADTPKTQDDQRSDAGLHYPH